MKGWRLRSTTWANIQCQCQLELTIGLLAHAHCQTSHLWPPCTLQQATVVRHEASGESLVKHKQRCQTGKDALFSQWQNGVKQPQLLVVKTSRHYL